MNCELFDRVRGHLSKAVYELEMSCGLIVDVEEVEEMDFKDSVTNLFLLKDWLIYLNNKISNTI